MLTELETWSIAQLGYLYFTRERYDEAERLFTGLVTLAPQHVYSWYVMALIALRRKDTQQALSYLQHILKLDPSHQEARLTFGEQLLRAGHRQDGRTVLGPLEGLRDHRGRRARLLLERYP